MIKDIFLKEISDEVIKRINKLTKDTQPQWGKINVSQMLAHLNVQYEVIYDTDKFPTPNFLAQLFLKIFVKKTVVGPKPFAKNERTAPYFIITSEKDFALEKERLIKYIIITQANGIEVLLKRDTKSFGKLTVKEWNTLFYKHINHHLTQFSV